MTKLNPTFQADLLLAEPQGKPFQMDFIKYRAHKTMIKLNQVNLRLFLTEYLN